MSTTTIITQFNQGGVGNVNGGLHEIGGGNGGGVITRKPEIITQGGTGLNTPKGPGV